MGDCVVLTRLWLDGRATEELPEQDAGRHRSRDEAERGTPDLPQLGGPHCTHKTGFYRPVPLSILSEVTEWFPVLSRPISSVLSRRLGFAALYRKRSARGSGPVECPAI